MGKSSTEMSVPTTGVCTRPGCVRSSQSLRLPNSRLNGNTIVRPKSADTTKREGSLTRKLSDINDRRSGSFSTRSRKAKTVRQETSNNYLQVPEIVIRRPSTDGEDSDTTSCPSRDRTPSPFGIDRERLPPGSPIFRRAMVELLSESDLSGEDNSNSDDSSINKDDKTNKTTKKGQSKTSKQKSSSSYKVVRYGKKVNVIRNCKR